ncbi:MAG TPA: T9SS type A sorting domain-containing protein, partial [Panacibacter sp.]|nr:T9SS type A sorting domain-containing protein [Panacibacter sp.]
YKNTNPKIYLLTNPGNKGDDEIPWLLQNCPGGWIKTGSMGKGYQLNDEKSKSRWLYYELNSPQSGDYVRCRSEITGGTTMSGWWLEAPYKNMFALMCYGVYWGLDMSNQGNGELQTSSYDSSFKFFNKYAMNGSQKNAPKSTNAMCALKDGLDAADSIRFPAATYGAVSRTNLLRYLNIANKFAAFGAKQGDVNTATLGELDNLYATAINDVGWDLFTGNYERYLHQISPNETSIGYWNVQSADTKSMYGRFARGFDIANNKKAFYFDVDSSFLNYVPLDGKYAITIEITYLDDTDASWQLFYDSKTITDKPSILVTGTKTNKWKKASVTLTDAYFGNRGLSASDFSIRSSNNKKAIFSVVELSRTSSAIANINLFATTLPVFDTLCVNSTQPVKSFLLNGTSLDGTKVTVGPLAGYGFSAAATGPFADSINISGYSTSISQTVYVQLRTSVTGSFNSKLPVKGGGSSALYLPLYGTVVNTSPVLSANVTSLACKGDPDNGMIDLTTTGGTGPFTYYWTNSVQSFYDTYDQDISGLKPADYTVVVTSPAACTTTATYSITEPDALDIVFSLDSNIVCKDASTTLTVSATGGNVPYNGTGTFTVNSGIKTYTVRDAKGCTDIKNFTVSNGNQNVPNKPSSITGDDADAKGICGSDNFVYSVNAVSDATSYTWKTPTGVIVASTNASGNQATIKVNGSFSSGTLSVTADNKCGSSSAVTKTLTAIPGEPEKITGPKSVVKNKTGLSYAVSPVVAGVDYTWTVNSGARITSGQNSSAITVTWGNTAGKITVKASNSCGTSTTATLSITIQNNFASTTETVIESGSDESLISSGQSPSMETRLPVLRVLPNPAKDIAYLVFNAENQYKYFVEVTDLQGRVLLHKETAAIQGENRVNIDVHNYITGLYVVTLVNNKGERKSVKLVKD